MARLQVGIETGCLAPLWVERLSLRVAKLVNGELQHVDRVKPASALEWPAALLIDFDQRHKNVELVALRCAVNRSPKLLDLGESAAVVGISANRADVHGVFSLVLGNGQGVDRVVLGMRSEEFDEHDLSAKVE